MNVITVEGTVAAGELGLTLMHEHLHVDLHRELFRDGLLNDDALVEQELVRAQRAGIQTLVDCTSGGLDRRPELLKRFSEKVGIRVVMGCGHYREPYLDRGQIDRHTVDELADQIVTEIERGVGDTGIRPGIIGEVGSDPPSISAIEERCLRAAGKAHARTGLTVTTHCADWPGGLQQLEILRQEGVDPRRVIIGHCDTVVDRDYHEAIARQGAFVQFDCVRKTVEHELELRVDYILTLAAKGFLTSILLSQDVCRRSHLTAYGGGGYAFLIEEFVPRLQAAGLAEADIQQLLVENPRRALTGES